MDLEIWQLLRQSALDIHSISPDNCVLLSPIDPEYQMESDMLRCVSSEEEDEEEWRVSVAPNEAIFVPMIIKCDAILPKELGALSTEGLSFSITSSSHPLPLKSSSFMPSPQEFTLLNMTNNFVFHTGENSIFRFFSTNFYVVN